MRIFMSTYFVIVGFLGFLNISNNKSTLFMPVSILFEKAVVKTGWGSFKYLGVLMPSSPVTEISSGIIMPCLLAALYT